MLIDPKLINYLPAIRKLSQVNTFDKKNLLTKSFLLNKEGNLSMYYAPHNEYIEPSARVVLVGITPGFHQMKTAIQSVASHLQEHSQIEMLITQAKVDASLAGPMRANLIHMLDACGLADHLQIETTGDLFTTERSSLHTTSILKYPVFYKGSNYTGHQPKIHQSAMLKHFACEVFPEELNVLTNACIIIPLGKVVDQVMNQLKDTFHTKHTIINGFPHPSGANGHRKKQFAANKEHITALIQQWSLDSN